MTDCPNEVAAKTKPDISLIAPDFLLGLADVLTSGRGSHAPRQWESGMKWTLAYNSLQRHLLAWLGGEDIDPQSGKSHLDHAACRIMMLSSYAKRGLGEDDRPLSPGRAACRRAFQEKELNWEPIKHGLPYDLVAGDHILTKTGSMTIKRVSYDGGCRYIVEDPHDIFSDMVVDADYPPVDCIGNVRAVS